LENWKIGKIKRKLIRHLVKVLLIVVYPKLKVSEAFQQPVFIHRIDERCLFLEMKCLLTQIQGQVTGSASETRLPGLYDGGYVEYAYE